MWFSLSCFMMSASWQRWPWSLRPDILTLDPKYPNQSKPPHDGNTKAQAAHQAAQNSVWRRVMTLHAIETLGSVVTLTNHPQPMKLPISTNAIYECGEIHIDCYIFQYSWVLVIIYIYTILYHLYHLYYLYIYISANLISIGFIVGLSNKKCPVKGSETARATSIAELPCRFTEGEQNPLPLWQINSLPWKMTNL